MSKAGVNTNKKKTAYGRPLVPATVSKKNAPKYVCVKKKSKGPAEVRAGAVAWAIDVACDNRFHYGDHDAHHNGCYFCNHQIGKKGNKLRMFCYCCNPFVHAAYVHGGGAKALKKRCGHNALSFENRSGSSYFNGHSHFKHLHPKKMSDLIPGDVGCSGSHALMYIGKFNGKHKIVEASGGDDNRPGSTKWNNSVHTETKSSPSGYRWYRYKGPGGGKMYRRADCVGVGTTVYDDDDSSGGTSGGGSGYASDDGSGIILDKEIEKLWSSDNYEFVDIEYPQESEQVRTFREDVQRLIDEVGFTRVEGSYAVPDIAVGALTDYSAIFEKNKAKRLKNVPTVELLSYPNFVQAPTIVLDFNGTKIGGYGNVGDEYPNYIDSMSVKKINGRINQYTFNLSYQIRPNEDPNFIDKLLGKTGYRKPLKVLYGDSSYSGNYFREEEAVITNAIHKEDPASAKISYTITALSSISAAMKMTQTYDNTTNKPSSEIYNLLYNSGETSQALLSAFPGMANKNAVASSGLIPTTDAVVTIGGMANSNPVDRLGQLVSCMTNAAGDNSSYYLSYQDDNAMNGSYFKVTEVKKVSNSSAISGSSTVYTVDVGYPTNNFVTNFQLSDNVYWPLAYEFSGKVDAYDYDIGNDGQVYSKEANPLEKSIKYGNTGLIEQNWWKNVTEFPITAKLTLKGLVTPAMLMSYIEVNALFYGQRDMASGLYVVTEENDTISGSGYTTELTLLRVAED